MKIPDRPALLVSLRQHGTRIAHKINDFSRGWLWILWIAAQKTIKPDTGIMASAIAYFALFSLFPLTLLSISIASFSLGPAMDQHLIVQRLEFVAPALTQLIGKNMEQIFRARGAVGGAALIGLIWSASSVFYTLNHTLNDIWNMKQSRTALRRRGVAILFVLAFVGPTLLLISLAGSVIANLKFWLPNLILPFSGGISLTLTSLLDIVLFMAIYMMLPHGKSTWHEVLPGAMGAGLLWELAKKIFLAFVATHISISNLVYGTVATIIAFLAWAYLSSLIFIFGAYLSVSYWESKQREYPS